MKALTSPSCRVGLERGCYASSSCCSSFMRRSFEKCFLQSNLRVSGFGLLNSVLAKQRKAIIYPVSCLSSKTQVDFGAENARTEERHQSKTVRVKFHLLKECVFGEQFLIVGDDPMLGLWDPKSAVPLNWSEGHAWTVELDIPVGKSILFKFILKDNTGAIVWQPGPDRVFQTWETNNTINVSEDWENAELRILSEEEQVENQKEKEELAIQECSESGIANKDSNQVELPSVEQIKEQIVSNNVPQLQEKLKTLVAVDISYPMNHPIVNLSPQVLAEKRIDLTNENFTLSLDNEVTIVDEILGNNGRDAMVKNLASTNLVDYEGEPVLVPGLPTPTSVPIEEEKHDQVEEKISFDESVDAFEAKDHDLPEIQPDEKQELESNLSEEGMTDNKFDHDEEENLEHKLQQKPHVSKMEKQYDSETEDDVTSNDLRWVRETLLKFLNNFGARLF